MLFHIFVTEATWRTWVTEGGGVLWEHLHTVLCTMGSHWSGAGAHSVLLQYLWCLSGFIRQKTSDKRLCAEVRSHDQYLFKCFSCLSKCADIIYCRFCWFKWDWLNSLFLIKKAKYGKKWCFCFLFSHTQCFTSDDTPRVVLNSQLCYCTKVLMIL